MTDLKALFSDLVRFELELWNTVEARLRLDHDLPLTWFQPMQVMSRVPGCRVFDISDALGISVGGTSKLVDRIEAAGYCVRRPNPADRRSSIVELTPAGKKLVKSATRSLEDELEERIGSALPPRSVQQFASSLGRLKSALQRTDGAQGSEEVAG